MVSSLEKVRTRGGGVPTPATSCRFVDNGARVKGIRSYVAQRYPRNDKKAARAVGVRARGNDFQTQDRDKKGFAPASLSPPRSLTHAYTYMDARSQPGNDNNNKKGSKRGNDTTDGQNRDSPFPSPASPAPCSALRVSSAK